MAMADCEPSDDETVCLTCLMDTCCDTYLVCRAQYPVCSCLLDCVEQGYTMMQCRTSGVCPAVDSATDAFLQSSMRPCYVGCRQAGKC